MLIKCKECGKKVSSEAEICPHCGYKISENVNLEADVITNKKPFNKKILLFIGVAVVVLITVIISIFLIHNHNKSFTWSEKDFAFYDISGQEKGFTSMNNYWIHLSDYENLHTYNNIEIGSNASELLEKYDLTDFEWEIYSATNNDEAAKSKQNQYLSEQKTAKDVLEGADDIFASGMSLYLYCNIYKQNGKLCTLSDLDFSNIDSELENYSDFTDDFRVRLFKRHHLKYTISFNIENGIISDVSIENNYYNHIHSAYNSQGEFIKGYEWLKELE